MKKYFTLIFILIIFYAVIFDTLFISLKKTDGRFIYPVDDAYIHIAIAKNFAQHNVWGVTRYEFSSSSSSPLWTFILSILYKVFGVQDIIPFLLNLIFATLFIFLVYKISLQFFTKPILLFLFLLFYIFAIPLPTMVLLGMEHTLHILLCVATLYILSHHIISSPSKKDILQFLSLIALCASVRYENMFFIFAIILVLLSLKKYNLLLLTIFAGAFPIILVGIIQKIYGWYFLPTSILLKGNKLGFDLSTITTFFNSFHYNLFNLQYLFLLFVISIFLLFKNAFQDNFLLHKENIWRFIFILVCILHCASKPAGFFWIYRYEAYLVAIGFLSLLSGSLREIENKFILLSQKINIFQKFSVGIIILVAFGVFALPFGERILSYSFVPQASQNIYYQQYQMGLFLKKFYQGKTVAINDIGACCYLADIKLLDLWGLGSKESARNRFYPKPDFIYNWTKKEKCEIAIIYDAWFQGQTSKWIKVGSWTIPNNIVCAFDAVNFYAINESNARTLISNLRSFSKELPRDVIQNGNL